AVAAAMEDNIEPVSTVALRVTLCPATTAECHPHVSVVPEGDSFKASLLVNGEKHELNLKAP
ncbi:unnamed protein product, partial [Allacma fusca]